MKMYRADMGDHCILWLSSDKPDPHGCEIRPKEEGGNCAAFLDIIVFSPITPMWGRQAFHHRPGPVLWFQQGPNRKSIRYSYDRLQELPASGWLQ